MNSNTSGSLLRGMLLAALVACGPSPDSGPLTAPVAPTLSRTDDEAPSAYQIELLTMPVGIKTSFAYAVNERGDIVGAFRGPPASPSTPAVLRAFIDRGNGGEDLGLLPGTVRALATGINNQREVVGWTVSERDANGVSALQGFIWTPQRGMEALPPLPRGQLYMRPTGINKRGDIVGCMYLDDYFSPQHMVVWRGDDHVPEDLGTGPGDGGACGSAINAKGIIAGGIGSDTPVQHAVIFDDRFSLLGELPGETQSVAVDINETGEVVGVNYNRFSVDATVAFIWSNRLGMRAIPLLAGITSAGSAGINNSSVVVGGGLATRSSTCQHPWVWSSRSATAPTLLPTLTGFHPEADCPFGLKTQTAAINEVGMIVGQSASADGYTHAVRWVRVASETEK